MLVVGAIAEDNSAGDFTNWSSQSVHLAAPGVKIWSTYLPSATENPGLYTSLGGTSMATPHVAGAVALVASGRPNLGAHQLKNLLNSAANRSINPRARGELLGSNIPPQNVANKTLSKYGLLDVKAALDAELPDVVPVTGVEVFSASSTLGTDNTLQLYAILTPEEATDIDVAWNSSDPAIAAVDAMGLVTAHAVGTATITATAVGGVDIFKSVNVTVQSGGGGSTPGTSDTPNSSFPPPSSPGGGSGGGCDTGMGFFVLLWAMGIWGIGRYYHASNKKINKTGK
jgi:uncharacterized protein YjdB